MSNWKHMDASAMPSDADLSPEDRATIEDVLDAADAWRAGDIPFYEAANIGTMLDWQGNASPPYTRYMALRHTPRADVRWKSLQALIDVLIVKAGWRITRQGIYGSWEIRESDECVERAGGHLLRDAA